MTPVEHLRAAKALIDTPDKWTKGNIAQDRHGNRAGAQDEEASCFCMIGALMRSNPPEDNAIAGASWGRSSSNAVLAALGRAANSSFIPDYNDREDVTHDDVMATFDAAIAELEVAA